MIDFIEIVAIAVICAAAFSLRLVPLIRTRWFGNDSYYHLIVSRWWRKYHEYPKSDPNLLPTNANTYPPLLQVLIYPFASISDRAAMMVLSPAIDLVTIIMLFIFSDWADLAQPLLPPLIYGISANNLLDASTLNPRPLGTLLIVGTILAIIAYADTGDPWAFTLLVFMESLVLLSHKLSVQVMVPIMVMISIIVMLDPKIPERGWPILGSLALSVLMAALLTGGAYLRRILPDHIRYIGVHLRHGDYRTGKRDFPSPINLIKQNPVAYIAPFLGWYMYFYDEPISGFGLWLPWSTAVVFLAQFWVWGDSWRYLQLGTFPSAMIVVHFITSYGFAESLDDALLILLMIALACVMVLQVRGAIARDKTSKIANAIGRIPDDWRRLVKGKRVYTNIQHYIVPYFLDSSLLLGSPSADGMKASFRIAELSRGSLKEIEKYAKDEIKEPLDYALIFTDFPSPSLEGYEPHLHSKELTIYKMSAA